MGSRLSNLFSKSGKKGAAASK